MVIRSVFRHWQNGKVFGSIVVLDAVTVMNMLVPFKMAAKHLFCHYSMLKAITAGLGSIVNVNIALPIKTATAFPTGVARTFLQGWAMASDEALWVTQHVSPFMVARPCDGGRSSATTQA